jgi:hypothetical protein
MSSGVTEILSGLWLGDHASSGDTNFLVDKQIQMVLNCDPHERTLPNNKKLLIKQSVKIPEQYRDTDHSIIIQYLDTYCDLIRKYISQYNILIYCHDGLRFAPILLAMYLIKYGKMSVKSTIACLESKRTNIGPFLSTHQKLLSVYQQRYQ